MGRPIANDLQQNIPPMDGLPVMSGRVSLVCRNTDGGAVKTPIQLKVYKPAFGGCFAVLSPDKMASIRDSGAVSLRKCTVRAVPKDETPTNEHHFRVTVDDRREGASLTFSAPSREQLINWVQGITKMTSSPTTILAPRKCMPLQRLQGGRRPMSPMPGASRRRGSSPTSLPSLQEEE